MNFIKWIFLVSILAAAGCDNNSKSSASTPERWYTSAQVAQGALVFQTHCAACHGENAEADPDWRIPGPDGHYPPPPLNGTAHAWHHPRSVLLQVIAKGGVPVGGVMPAFSDVLGGDDSLAAIAYFQSHWPDEIYARWLEIDSR